MGGKRDKVIYMIMLGWLMFKDKISSCQSVFTGLGKSEDGIREALQVQQTGRGAGTIVNTSATTPIVGASPPSRAQSNQVVPTKVILLTNMVFCFAGH